MTPVTLIYLGLGLVIARIMLDDVDLHGYTWLQWLQLLVNAGRITVFWPLVLFIEKLEHWLKDANDKEAHNDTDLDRHRRDG